MNKLTPIKAIKAKCIDCSGGIRKEVELCTATECPLYEYRNGTNPNRKARELTEEQKEKLKDNLAKARSKKLNS